MLAPGLALGVSLGELEVTSSQNEPLRASIPIQLEPGESAASVRAILATPDDFAAAGIDRRSYLRNLSLRVVTDADGQSRIDIRSQERISNAQLQFVVALDGPPQKVSRAYRTALSRSVQKQESEEKPGRADAHHYGPIRKNDNLWNIARDLHKPAGINNEQMVLALIRSNPEVFQGKSFAMRVGEIMSVPDISLISQLGPEQAKKIYELVRSGRNIKRSDILAAIDKSLLSPVNPTPAAEVASPAPATIVTPVVPASAPTAAHAQTAPVSIPSTQNTQANPEASALLESIRKERLQLQDENEKVRSHVLQLQQQIESLQEQIQLQNDAIRKTRPPQQAAPPATNAPRKTGTEETEQASFLGFPVSDRFLLLLGAGSVAVSGLLGILWSTRRMDAPSPVPPPPSRFDYQAPAAPSLRSGRETAMPGDAPKLGGGLDELLNRLNTLRPVDEPVKTPPPPEPDITLEAPTVTQPVRQTKPRGKRGLNKLTDPSDPATTQYKLDLAKTCIQQGDKDLANTLLQDVIRKGKASQRDEALNLLQALSS